MSYKKRDKGGWNQGKAYKGSRKAKEREHTKRDIKQQIDEQDPNYKLPHKSKPTPNRKLRLEHRIKWYEKILSRNQSKDSNYSSWITSTFGSMLRRLKKKWAEKYDKEK